MHACILQISLNIHKEPVFPVFPRNRPGFDHDHVDMIEDEVSQHVIEGTAGMRQFKAETDLACSLLIDLTVCQDHKAGCVALIILDGRL